VWHRGTRIELMQRVNLPVSRYLEQMHELSNYDEIPYMADNLVFLTNDPSKDSLDRDILYSILDKRPKRAKAYWFLNVSVTDEPYTHEFWVNDFGTDFVFKVQLRLGFRVNQRVNEYLYQIVSTMVEQGRLPAQDHRFSIYERTGHVGDFRFCLVRKVPSVSSDISRTDLGILQAKYIIRGACGSPDHLYGLENSSVMYEYVPLFVGTKRQHKLAYVEMPK
jgi:KUP system potassium uptake protein